MPASFAFHVARRPHPYLNEYRSLDSVRAMPKLARHTVTFAAASTAVGVERGARARYFMQSTILPSLALSPNSVPSLGF